MFRIVSLSCAGFALLMGVSMSAGPANAVVYCKTAGVPKGCVARPAVAARRAVSPKVALCDDCLWHKCEGPTGSEIVCLSG